MYGKNTRQIHQSIITIVAGRAAARHASSPRGGFCQSGKRSGRSHSHQSLQAPDHSFTLSDFVVCQQAFIEEEQNDVSAANTFFISYGFGYLFIYLFGWDKKKLSRFDKSAVWLIPSHQQRREALLIIYKHGTKTNHVWRKCGTVCQLFRSFCLYHMLFSSGV